ncbi:MAG: GNAT family N-acetyltransferase [Actinomycetota bacterium]
MSRAEVLKYDVREYRDEDEAEVLDLLVASLGGGPGGNRTPQFFRWKHLDSPFGRSLMLLAHQGDRIIGFRSFMRWRFRSGGEELACVRAVDTATHPEHQGQGVFSRLTLDALEALRPNTDLVFNTPNGKSGPGYLKMGWRRVCSLPVSVRVRRPLHFARNLRSLRSDSTAGSPPAIDASPAAEELADTEQVRALLTRLSYDDRFTTERSLEYLRWRYGAAPLLDYRALTAKVDGELRGLLIFRVRPRGSLWESTVAEVLVAPTDDRTARSLLRWATRAAAVDHLTIHLPARSPLTRSSMLTGFVPSPRGMDLFVNPLRGNIQPPPEKFESWALSLGDLEVF